MRRRQHIAVGMAVICGVVFAAPVQAHHSHGNYVSTFADIEGVVKEVHFVNPHSWIYLEVAAADRLEIWALEATNPISLKRIGVADDVVAPGDRIKVRCHPLRDGSRGCLLGFVKISDGAITDWDGTNLPIPADF